MENKKEEKFASIKQSYMQRRSPQILKFTCHVRYNPDTLNNDQEEKEM